MEFKLIKMREDMLSESGYLLKNMSPFFNSKFKCYVNFSLEFLDNPIAVPVFYSKKHKFWSARYKDRNELIHAFGKCDESSFFLANSRLKPLDPLFVFSLPINYEDVKYESLFVKKGKKCHFMSKIYDLDDSVEKYLKEQGLVLEMEDEDYLLFDFGNCHKIIKFLYGLENYVNTFNFKLNDDNHLTIDLNPYMSFIDLNDYKYCMMCGEELGLTVHKELKEYAEKYGAKCETCLEKIYALDIYYKIKDSSLSKYISEESLKAYFDNDNSVYYAWSLLIKYDMLENFTGDLYELRSNDILEKSFSPFLKPQEEEFTVKKSKLDDYWSQYDDDEDDEEERFCRVCGKSLNDELTDICDDCFNKQESVKSLKKLLEYVSPGKGFSKADLLKKEFSTLELDILFSDLINVGLLKSVGDDDLFILEKVSILNEFIEKYSDEELISVEESEDDDSKLRVSILASDLKTEESLDKAINLVNYTKNVYINKRANGWFVEFKDNGLVVGRKLFNTPFKAKLSAINYLSELNLINVIHEDKPTVSEVKTDSEKYKICPVCNKEFDSNNKSKYCDECKSKYRYRELTVLEAINKGEYTKELAIKINNLRESGKDDGEIAIICNLKFPGVVEPILKFLLPDGISEDIESNDVSELMESDDVEESKSSDLTDSIRVCALCGKKFHPNTKFSSSQKYCNSCKNQFNGLELSILTEINNGNITQDMSNKIKSMLNNGMTRKSIAEYFNFKNGAWIEPIINFLPPKDIVFDFDESSKDNEPDLVLKKCLVCNKEFYGPSSKSGQKYCDVCKSKYDSMELLALRLINENKVTQTTSNKIYYLLNKGVSKTKISERFNLGTTSVIDPIFKFLPPVEFMDKSNNSNLILKKCLVCNKEFYGPSSKSGQKYCDVCKSKYDSMELLALRLINENKVTQTTSNKIFELLSKEVPKREIANSFNLGNSAVIDPILKFLPPIEQIPKETTETIDTDNFKFCSLCGDKFYLTDKYDNNKYCEDCRNKYSDVDIKVIKGIIFNIFTKSTYYDIIDLQRKNVSKEEIVNRLSLPSVEYIGPMSKYLSAYGEDIPDKIVKNVTKQRYKYQKPKKTHKPKPKPKPKPKKRPLKVPVKPQKGDTVIDVFGDNYSPSTDVFASSIPVRVCSVCGSEFYPKESSQDCCEDCEFEYSESERDVLKLINNGTIDAIIAAEILRLRLKGYSDEDIARKLDFAKPSWVQHTLVFIPTEEYIDNVEINRAKDSSEDIIESRDVDTNPSEFEIDNLPVENDLSTSKCYKSLEIIKSSNHTLLNLKGLILNNDLVSLFNDFTSFSQSNLKYIECTNVDELFEVNFELIFDNDEAEEHIDKFKSKGWIENNGE